MLSRIKKDKRIAARQEKIKKRRAYKKEFESRGRIVIDGYEDNRGELYDSKEKAQVASFMNVIHAGFKNGFPFFIPRFWYNAITFYPFIMFRKDSVNVQRLVHEIVHIRQQREMLIVGAYVWYGIELLIRLLMTRSIRLAYLQHSMEREARENADNKQYPLTRKPYAFLKYLRPAKPEVKDSLTYFPEF